MELKELDNAELIDIINKRGIEINAADEIIKRLTFTENMKCCGNCAVGECNTKSSKYCEKWKFDNLTRAGRMRIR